MWPVRLACSDRASLSRVLSACGVVSVIGVLSVPITLGLGPDVVPIQVHAAEGWGQPAVDASRVYYLSKRHELIAVARNSDGEQWRTALGDGAGVTAGTRVLVEGSTVVAGDDDVFGFDPASGLPKWRFTSASRDAAGSYLGHSSGGLVFAGSRSGRVYAIEAETGTLRWASSALGDRVLVHAPVVDGGHTRLGNQSGGADDGDDRDARGDGRTKGRENDVADEIAATYIELDATPRRGGLVLLDGVQGSVRWRASFPEREPDTAVGAGGAPVFAEAIIAAASSDGTIYGFDRSSGAIVWTLPPIGSDDPGGRNATPADDVRALAFADGVIVATSLTGTLVAIDAPTGRERWRYVSPQDGSIAFAVVSDGRTAFLPYASGRLVAVDLIHGRARWRVGGSALRFEHPPAVSQHRVYVTSEDGLYAVEDTADADRP